MEVLRFYNYIFLVAVCLYMAMKVFGDNLFVTCMLVLLSTALLSFYRSVVFLATGLTLTSDLPESELRHMPESAFLYLVYLACFVFNGVFLFVLSYFLAYFAMLTY